DYTLVTTLRQFASRGPDLNPRTLLNDKRCPCSIRPIGARVFNVLRIARNDPDHHLCQRPGIVAPDLEYAIPIEPYVAVYFPLSIPIVRLQFFAVSDPSQLASLQG